MSLYEKLLKEVKEGNKFCINLKDKTLKIYNSEIKNDTNDELITNEDLKEYEIDNILESPYEVIEKLYHIYRHSIPSKYSINKKCYFSGLSVDDLTDYEMVNNIPRHEAQAMLEGFILFSSLNGNLIWSEPKNWFWQGTDKTLVILKEWI